MLSLVSKQTEETPLSIDLNDGWFSMTIKFERLNKIVIDSFSIEIRYLSKSWITYLLIPSFSLWEPLPFDEVDLWTLFDIIKRASSVEGLPVLKCFR